MPGDEVGVRHEHHALGIVLLQLWRAGIEYALNECAQRPVFGRHGACGGRRSRPLHDCLGLCGSLLSSDLLMSPLCP